MSQSKNTRRVLLSSVLAMVVCIAMLIGSTFAWFTDSVKSGNNKIVAGNLDIDVQYSKDKENWAPVEEASDIFDSEAVWEPGHTDVIYLKISNEGSLALKYQLSVVVANETAGINQNGEEFKLSDFIQVGQVENVDAAYTDRSSAINAVNNNTVSINDGYAFTSNIESGSDDQILALVVYMPDSVGNAANYQSGTAVPTIDFSLNITATQLSSENDGFSDTYDKNAFYSIEIKSQEDFDKALDGNGLSTLVIDKDATVVMNDKSFVGKNTAPAIVNYGTMTITDSTIDSIESSAQSHHAITNYGTLTVDNSQIGSVNTRGNAIRNYGDATISNSTLQCCNNYLNGGYAYVVACSAGTLTINNCNYTGQANGVFAADGGNIVINGGQYVLNGAKSFYMFYTVNGNITVNGGEFTKDNNNKPMAYAAADTLAEHISIQDGTFKLNGNDWTLQ